MHRHADVFAHVAADLGGEKAFDWCRVASGCYGSERSASAFYYLDVFVNAAPLRLARPYMDRLHAIGRGPFDDIEYIHDFGLPEGSDLRMWATPRLAVRENSMIRRPELATLLKGMKEIAAHERVDFIITDLPEMHQIIPQNITDTTTAAAQVVAWAEEMAALNVTVGARHEFTSHHSQLWVSLVSPLPGSAVYSPFSLQDERKKLPRFKRQDRAWAIAKYEAIISQLDGTSLQLLDLASTADWKFHGDVTDDAVHQRFPFAQQNAMILIWAIGQLQSLQPASSTCRSSRVGRLQARKAGAKHEKRWFGFNDERTCCGAGEFLNCRTCCHGKDGKSTCKYIGVWDSSRLSCASPENTSVLPRRGKYRRWHG